MSKSVRNIVLIMTLICCSGTVRAGGSTSPSRTDPAAPGATGIDLSGSFRGLVISAALPVFFVSSGGYSQSTGTGNLADVTAGLTAQDPVVLFLIGLGLATLGAIGLHRLAKSPSDIQAGRRRRMDGSPDRRRDSQ